MYTKRAEFKAGLIVLAGLAALLAFFYFAGGAIKPWHKYVDWYVELAPGSVAPRRGDPVQMNGVVVGKVDDVKKITRTRRGAELTAEDRLALGIASGDDVSDREVREHRVSVRLRLPADLSLPTSTQAEMRTNIAGLRDLHLLPGLAPENLSPGATAARPIPGGEAPGVASITEQLSGTLGGLEKAAQSVTQLGVDGRAMVGDVRSLLDTLHKKIAALDTKTVSDEVVETVRALRSTAEGLGGRIDTIATNLEQASAHAAEFTQEGREALAEVRTDLKRVMGNADDALASVRRSADQVESLVADNAPAVTEFVNTLVVSGKNVEALTAELSGLGPQAKGILTELGMDADEVLGSLKDTAHNLFDASEDLRAHPWKLLNEPEAKEIAFDNLRSASHGYLTAMRDLNSASKRLSELLKQGAAEDATLRPLLERASAGFQRALERYENYEARFARLLEQSGPAR